MHPGPYQLDTDRYILGPDGTGLVKRVSPCFYQELDREFDSFRGHTLVQRFAFDSDWPTWEMHPAGDEFVLLLDGAVEFVLWESGEERAVQMNEPGYYVVVPKGTWHTARPRPQADMLFLTPGEGTLNAEAPG